MTKIIDVTRDDPTAVVGDLIYVAYRFNRNRSPDVTPEQWARVFFPGAAALEARYQAEPRMGW